MQNILTTPIEFTLDELLYMHAVIRSYNDLDLNQQIVECLLLIKRNVAETSATVNVTFNQLLIIDDLVKMDAKTKDSTMVGKNILYKSFEARDTLLNNLGFSSAGTDHETVEMLDRLKKYRKDTNANRDNDSNDYAGTT